MAKIKITEEEVAKVTSILFKHWGYDLYYECQLSCFGGRPDIIATRGSGWCSVIECKQKLDYKVLEQVCRWWIEKDFCEKSEWVKEEDRPDRFAVPNFLWVATSNSHSGKISDMKNYLLNKFKIGWIDIEVNFELPDGWDEKDYYKFNTIPDGTLDKYSSDDYGSIRIGNRLYDYRIVCDAGIQEGSRRTSHHIVSQLLPEMKDSVAGVTADKANYVTPFKLTLQRTVEIMQPNVWYKPAELLELLRASGYDHHYSKDATYKSSIGGWLVKFGHAESNTEWNKKYRLKVDT